jgi:RND family efflux transporter MFP subunit
MRIFLEIVMISALLIGGGAVGAGCSRSNSAERVKAHQSMYHCPMHPEYLSAQPGDCPICGMKLVPIGSKTPSADARRQGAPATPDNAVHIDPVTVQNMGVSVDAARVRSLSKDIRAGAVVTIDETRQAVVSTKVMGWIEKLLVASTGARVRKGEPLFELYSPDLVSTQEEYLQAKKYSLRAGGNDSSGAEDLLKSTRRRLANWDVSEELLAAIDREGKSRRTLSIVSPLTGVVLEKNAIEGQNVMPGSLLFRIADLSTVWVVASVYQSDLPFVKIGMKASIEVQSQPGRSYSGTVHFVSPVIDPDSRTAQIRIVVGNSADFDLKPDMFADVVIHSPAPIRSVTVPEQAVIHTGERTVVVVDLGGGYYRPQEVRLGIAAGGYVQIMEGVEDGQRIVTSSQFLIDSESNLKIAISQMSGGKRDTLSRENVAASPGDTAGMTGAGTAAMVPITRVKWICPMDSDVVGDKPGKCPKCGMNLQKKE